MKKKLVLGGALVLLVALMAWGTWAYFTTEAHVTNVITTGTIQISLDEKTTGGAEFPVNGVHGVMPGTSVDKLVTVQNDGTGDSWIRVGVASTITGADGKTLPLRLADQSDALQFDIQVGWIYGGDGYYYYTNPLRGTDDTHSGATEKTTGPLFTKVTFNPKMPNKYQGCTVNIAVSAQAVQVKNNNSYKDAGDNTVTITALTADTIGKISGWPKPAETPAD